MPLVVWSELWCTYAKLGEDPTPQNSTLGTTSERGTQYVLMSVDQIIILLIERKIGAAFLGFTDGTPNNRSKVPNLDLASLTNLGKIYA